MKELWPMEETPGYAVSCKKDGCTLREILTDRMKPICFVFQLSLRRREIVADKTPRVVLRITTVSTMH